MVSQCSQTKHSIYISILPPYLISFPLFHHWLNGTSAIQSPLHALYLIALDPSGSLTWTQYHDKHCTSVVETSINISVWESKTGDKVPPPAGLQLMVCVFLFQGLTVCLDPKRFQGCLDSVVPITIPGIGYTGHHLHSPPLHSGPNRQMLKEAALPTVTIEIETGNERERKNESEKKGTLSLLGKMRKIRTGWCCKSILILLFFFVPLL